MLNELVNRTYLPACACLCVTHVHYAAQRFNVVIRDVTSQICGRNN